MEQRESDEYGYVTLCIDDETLLRGLSTLRWNLDELLNGQPAELVVDIAGLSRLSSPTLAALLRAQRICRRRGGRVVLRGANKRCREVLTGTGLVDLFGMANGHGGRTTVGRDAATLRMAVSRPGRGYERRRAAEPANG